MLKIRIFKDVKKIKANQMILFFLVFFLNVFGSDNQKLEIYTNGSKYFYGEITKNCDTRVTIEGVEVYNNQKLTNENTLIISCDDKECFRKSIVTTPYTTSAIQRYIGYDNGWVYTFFLKKKNNSFQDNRDKNFWDFASSKTETTQTYNFKVINNGNGKIMYDANQELLSTDFLKCIIQSIGKARDCNEEQYDSRKGIITGTEVQIHTYIPKTKLRKNIETGLWCIGFGTWLISTMTCLVIYSLAKQKEKISEI